MSILRMVGSMLANKSAILIIQQQADTDDNADSDDDFMTTFKEINIAAIRCMHTKTFGITFRA